MAGTFGSRTVTELRRRWVIRLLSSTRWGVFQSWWAQVLPWAQDVDAQGRGVIYVYDPNWPGEQLHRG